MFLKKYLKVTNNLYPEKRKNKAYNYITRTERLICIVLFALVPMLTAIPLVFIFSFPKNIMLLISCIIFSYVWQIVLQFNFLEVYLLWIIYKKNNKNSYEKIIIDSLIELKPNYYYSLLYGTVKNIRVCGSNIIPLPRVVLKGKIRNKFIVIKIKSNSGIIIFNNKKIIIKDKLSSSEEVMFKIKESIEINLN
jgi:hypothetical protein